MTSPSSTTIRTLLGPHRTWFLAGLTCIVGAAALAVLPAVAVVETVGGPAWRWVWLAVGSLLGAAALQSLGSYLSHEAELRVELDLRVRLAEHVSVLPVTTLARLSTGRLRSTLGEDVSALHHLLAHLPGDIATGLVTPVLALAAMTAYAGPVALLTLVPAVLAAVLLLAVVPARSRSLAADQQRIVEEIVASTADLTRGIPVARVYGQDAGALRRYRDSTTRFAVEFRRWVRRVCLPASVAQALLHPVVTLVLAGLLGLGRPATAQAALLVCAVTLTVPVLRLGHGLDYVGAGRAAAGRIGELLAEPTLGTGTGTDPRRPSSSVDASVSAAPRPPARPGAATGPVPDLDAPAALTVRDLVVVLDGRTVLDSVSLTVVPGALTALVGPSGSGKTTLLRALGRGIDPTSGSVHVGTADYADLPLGRTAEHVVTVPQNPTVLPRSVRENLLLADPTLSDDALRAALSTAALDVDLDAPAEVLSGGERQRLAIARAVLGPAPVLLLDEPTSALDQTTARTVLDNLAALPGRTVVLVSHRAADTASADVVVHVHDGKVLA